MALRQYTVTLGAGNTRAVTVHTPISFLRIENEASNAVVKYGTSALAAADYAGAVLAQTATINNAVTVGPFPHGIMNLDEFYFLGTEAQKIHLTAITP
jgi:hypothetical protein